jgi:PelA/Pel-15E family pectate lyase
MDINRNENPAGAAWVLVLLLSPIGSCASGADAALRSQTIATMRKAATFYLTDVASHGGYVYYYSTDLKQRWGEGVATPSQIWVQPPGTPTVGMAYLRAHEATGDGFYLRAAQEAAEALIYGQLESGGWTNSIDFDPGGQTARYRRGGGNGKNHSSLDDGQTQSAIRFLIRADKALALGHREIHEAARFALDALLAAQFPNGAFPQVWTGPVTPHPVVKADYPDYDWRTEGRIKNYWAMYTLNDNVAGYVAEALIEAHAIYGDDRYEAALRRLGDFLVLAQMPNPQPAWAQQYNYEMRPIWARKFEPPAIASDESQEVMATLLKIYGVTGDPKYLEPIPRALAYLKRSLLPDGRLARFYELKTNRPLYMFRRGDAYTLTYSDTDLPKHYGWKIDSRLDTIERQYLQLRRYSQDAQTSSRRTDLSERVREIIDDLDEQGRWVSVYRGQRLVGQPEFEPGYRYIASAVFAQNIETLSDYLIATRGD